MRRTFGGGGGGGGGKEGEEGRCVPESCAICLEPLRALEVMVHDDDDDDEDDDDDAKENNKKPNSKKSDAAKVTCLECLHFYHTKCWESWGTRNASCPECKRAVTML